MTYTVSFLPSAAREFRKLPRTVQQRIADAINGLQDNPRPAGCTSLRGVVGLLRIRVGDYRVIYRVDDAATTLEVLIIKIGHRKDVYRRIEQLMKAAFGIHSPQPPP